MEPNLLPEGKSFNTYTCISINPNSRSIVNALKEGYAVGLGIEKAAMPSLHVTMAAVWTERCTPVFRRQWLIPRITISALIAELSISLGWHYAVEGIADAASSVGCYFVLLSYYQRKSRLMQLAHT